MNSNDVLLLLCVLKIEITSALFPEHYYTRCVLHTVHTFSPFEMSLRYLGVHRRDLR